MSASSPTVPRSARRPARTDGLKLVGAMVALMWVSEMVDVVLGGRLDRLGIEPRDLDGLIGVALAPFLHVGFGHLIANTFPFLVMGGAIALAGAVVVLLFGTALLGGLVPQQGISWQAHLFGAAGGIAAARLLARRREEHPARA